MTAVEEARSGRLLGRYLVVYGSFAMLNGLSMRFPDQLGGQRPRVPADEPLGV